MLTFLLTLPQSGFLLSFFYVNIYILHWILYISSETETQTQIEPEALRIDVSLELFKLQNVHCIYKY